MMDLRIEKLVYGGDGLAHHDGRAVFVPLVLPGERVTAEPVEDKKKFIRARLKGIVEPSVERVAAPCPYFGRCGGCDYQHMAYEAQVRCKVEILRETLSRIGRIEWTGPITLRLSPPFGYRNRAQWKIRANGGGASPELGYFESRSTRLCSVTECQVLSPLLAKSLPALRQALASEKSLASLDEVEIFADDAAQSLLVSGSAAGIKGPIAAVAESLRQALPETHSILVQDRRAATFELFGPGYITYAAGGHAYRVGHLSFFQINRFLIEELISTIIGDARGNLALDLYAGVGLFTVALAARYERVVGVESNLAAAKDLEFNLHQSGSHSTASRHATAESFLARWHERPDFVVLDPPRAGLAPQTVASLRKLAPPGIAYLSCDPSTLARDLAALIGGPAAPGPFQIQDIYLFDIFPQTYHMEVLVRLQRRT